MLHVTMNQSPFQHFNLCRFNVILLCVSLLCLNSSAQTNLPEQNTETTIKNWEVVFGLDLSQMLQINPPIGQGESRINLGIDLNVEHRTPGIKSFWTKSLIVDYVVQRIGSGTSPFNDSIKVAFQKSNDLFRFSSHYGQLLPHSSNKLFWGVDAFIITQLSKTFEGNLMRDLTGNGPQARMLSPVTTTLGPGISYRPDGLAKEQERFFIYYSPVTWKMILVADDEIARTPALNDRSGEIEFLGSFHGNPLEYDTSLMQVSDYGKARMHLGSFFRFRYDDILLRDKIRTDGFALTWDSDLTLFLDYLASPLRPDIDWRNSFSAKVFKGIELSLLLHLFYDDDRTLQKTNVELSTGNSSRGVRFTKGVSFTQRILLRYRLKF